MKNIILFLFAIFFSMAVSASELRGYAEKCSELIEQAKSPASNWTTSIKEAAMAGECIGVLKSINEFIDNLAIPVRVRVYGQDRNRFKHYSCLDGGVLSQAQVLVDNGAVSFDDVVKILCHKY